MPPKVPDQKRKCGRPPGASKPKPDASSHQAPEHDAEPDAEERARPRKRGRKSKAEDTSTELALARSDNGPAQPSRVGRPSKKSQQIAAADAQPESEQRERRAKPGQNIGSNDKAAPIKSKPKAASHSEPREEQTDSSERERSGRGRRPGTSAEISDAGSPDPPEDAPTNKRKALKGKEKAVESETSTKEDEPSASTQRRSGRDRRTRKTDRNSSESPQNSEHEVQPTTATANTKSKTRSHGARQEAAASEAQEHEPVAQVGKKRRGRPSLNKGDTGIVQALQPQQGNRAKAPGNSSKADRPLAGTDTIEEPPQPKRRGRPRQSDISSQGADPEQPSRPRGRPRRPSPEAGNEQEQGQPPAKNKRKQQQPRQMEPVVEEEEEDAGSDEEEQEFPFRYLKESTKNIPRSVIAEKWNALDGPSINTVSTFLADAQRPVLLRLQDTNRRREHASTALLDISRRLRTKLVRGLPFPAPTTGPARRAAAGSYEDEFDFERAMNAVQSLENTLNPLLHSVSLLEREIKKEEDALAKDYDSLHKLEANARSEAKGWREKAKREHVLAPGIRRKGDSGDFDGDGDRLELVARPEEAPLGGLFKDLDDEELITLSKQIGSHMESMQSNLQQTDGVVPAISRSKAALQQVVLKYLDEDQYDKVLLG
ncbi:hypothetical protein J7T55_005981 [Diaporthe amygdali]|uniref:uncharacterized protein n=1 Tax=Phomopsis amygdali TaxID=1214568 RepID=UPI0022FF154A|nr:uncharacterized protein J7T55_005981 [Diaporthe amygdali]KAJ0124641.1 hypothetical protein J7T55_005981 [Diaporthe amygdali]